MNTEVINKLLGTAIHEIRNGSSYFAQDDTEVILTAAQKRRITWLLENGIPDTITAEVVDAEAGSRILEIAPEYMQRNATARSVELTEKIAEGGTLTAEEEAERTAMRGLWATVKAIRVASNTIKAGDTLPSDYSALVDAFNSELS